MKYCVENKDVKSVESLISKRNKLAVQLAEVEQSISAHVSEFAGDGFVEFSSGRILFTNIEGKTISIPELLIKRVLSKCSDQIR